MFVKNLIQNVMERIVGYVISKNSNFKYAIKWDMENETAWISQQDAWVMICTNVKTEKAALKCAQREINFQEYLY